MEAQNKIFNNFDKACNFDETCDCEESCNYEESCRKVSYKCVDISVPIELKPSATVGKIETQCYGDPDISCRENCDNSCDIVISQKVCVKIPIKYEVISNVGNAFNCSD